MSSFPVLIRSLSAAIAIIGIVGWGRWARVVGRNRFAYAFAPLWYLAQVVILYVLLPIYMSVYSELFSNLAAILTLEGVIILTGSAFTMTFFAIQRKRHSNNNGQHEWTGTT